MAQFKVVPWINRKEVGKVYDELFSGDILQQKHAVGRIAVWKSRQVHKLPLALESTAAFIKADIEWQRSAPSQDDLHLRSLYSMALLRCVNHMTERGQNRAFARPVHVLAAEIGMPEWIVEVRHAATHGSLPSLVLLRAAARWALQWLKDEFWAVQVEGPSQPATPEPSNGANQDDAIRDMLVAFHQQRFQQVGDGPTGAKFDDQLMLDIERACTDSRTAVFQCLMEEGYLISTADQLSSMGISTRDLVDSRNLHLPSKLIAFWHPLFRLLQRRDLVITFLLSLMAEVTDGPSLRNRLLLGWIYNAVDHNNPRQPYLGKDCLFRISFPMPYKHMLDVCANIVGPYTPSLVKLILSRMSPTDICDARRQQLQHIVDTVCGDADHHDDMETDVASTEIAIKDVSDLQATAHQWTRCSGKTDWSRTPLGLLPGQNIGYTTLELSADAGSDDDTIADSDDEVGMGTSTCLMVADEVELGPGDATSGAVTHSVLWGQTVIDHIKTNISIL